MLGPFVGAVGDEVGLFVGFFVAGACAAVVGEVVVGNDDGWVVVVGGLLIVGEGVLNSNKSSVLVKCDAGKFPRFGHT